MAQANVEKVRAKYEETKFMFGLREDGSRIAIRPNEILVRYDGNPEILQRAFDLAGKSGREHRTVEGQELVPDRVVNGTWGVVTLADGLDPRAVVEELRRTEVSGQPIVAQVNNVYFSGALEGSAAVAANRAAPNYAVPNYAVPNYAVPNYAVPNYAVPNYAVPNYAVPNYAVPNYAVGHRGHCRCERCVAEPENPPTVPTITARRARVPLADLTPNYAGDLQIHVLDVRPQLSQTTAESMPLPEFQEVDGQLFVDDAATDSRTARANLIVKAGALLPEALYLHEEIVNPTREPDENASEPGRHYKELRAAYVVEPFSNGFGANVNDDSYIDPTTNHGEFIKGIIDRIIRPIPTDDQTTPNSFVKMHSVMGTLGDISDAELAKAMTFIDEQDAAAGRTDESIRIMNLSLAGYSEVPDGGTDCLAETVAHLIERGWIVVASAGNDGNCRPTRPASLPGVVAVGAYGPDGPAWFSNYGPWVDACAPGVDVVSNFRNIQAPGMRVDEQISANEEFTSGYASWSGTSFAAPFASAMIGRWMLKETADFNAAKAALLHHPDALQFPGYGTVVSFATTRTKVDRSSDWI